MTCAFRCGRGKIEYNPQIIDTLDDQHLEQFLKAEVIRILLKHPYDRQPDGCKRSSMSIGSNLVLSDNYDFSDIGLPKPEDYGLEKEQSYEWYSFRIEELAAQEASKQKGKDDGENGQESNGKKSRSDEDQGQGDIGDGQGEKDGDSQQTESDSFSSDDVEIQLPDGTLMKIPSKGKGSPQQSQSKPSSGNEEKDQEDSQDESTDPNEDLSQLWEEDSMMSCSIDAAIDQIEATNSWGSLAGIISEKIIANTKARIDYRKVLSGFRASVLSSKRNLTRMRPNRRSGFDNMGSIRRFNTNILIAVDVSGSISDITLQHFFSIINRAFKYGIEKIDVVQFDWDLKEVVPLEKAKKVITVTGRGGTSFQPVFDFVAKNPKYDGLIILTDGYADHPIRPKRMTFKVAWVCDTIEHYERNKSWMKETGRSCAIQI